MPWPYEVFRYCELQGISNKLSMVIDSQMHNEMIQSCRRSHYVHLLYLPSRAAGYRLMYLLNRSPVAHPSVSYIIGQCHWTISTKLVHDRMITPV